MKIKKYSEKFESRNHGELDLNEHDEDLKKLQRYYAKKHELGFVNEDDEDYIPPSDLPKKENKEEIEPSDDDLKSIEELMKGEEEVEEEIEEADPIVKKSDDVKTGEGYTEDDLDADMENLTSLVRELFKNTGIEAQVMFNGLDIDIYVFLHKREKMKMLLKVFDTVVKLKKEILPQYESAVELYESKEKWPILQFKFEYQTGVSSNSIVVTKSEETPPPIPKALPPSSVTNDIKQTKLFGDDEKVDMGNKTDRGSDLPF